MVKCTKKSRLNENRSRKCDDKGIKTGRSRDFKSLGVIVTRMEVV